MKLYFNKLYFYLFLILFFVEACIAYFLTGGFIRHTFGDVLAVIMVYCFLMSFIKTNANILAVFVLVISFCVEYLQYFKFINRIGLQDNKIANLVLGNTYHALDLLAYIIGITIVLYLESKLTKHT